MGTFGGRIPPKSTSPKVPPVGTLGEYLWGVEVPGPQVLRGGTFGGYFQEVHLVITYHSGKVDGGNATGNVSQLVEPS